MKGIMVGAALAALLAFPAFAASSDRDSAVRECSAAAGKYTEYTWGDMEIYQYRSCMAKHRQAE